jgi:hypothetical protein
MFTVGIICFFSFVHSSMQAFFQFSKRFQHVHMNYVKNLLSTPLNPSCVSRRSSSHPVIRGSAAVTVVPVLFAHMAGAVARISTCVPHLNGSESGDAERRCDQPTAGIISKLLVVKELPFLVSLKSFSV